jgi:Co/Zn/Cd efflux system component
MNKTTFRIAKMDCPSEEQLIRMRLEGLTNIHSLQFDISNRRLTVHHSGNSDHIYRRLESLDLDTSFIETVPAVGTVPTGSQDQDKRILWMVLGINLFFFVLEMLAGFLAGSMGLVADSLDMLADSIVYSLALFAAGGTMTRKNNIAKASGWFQLFLALLGFVEVIRRFVVPEPVPAFQTMIIISLLALMGNAACLYLLQKSRSREAHIQASMIFTSNDVIANLGVILAGVFVLLTNSRYPDLIIGFIVFALVARGAFRILRLAGKHYSL